MLFTQLLFLPFFLLVLVVHWSLRHPVARKAWLLAASLAFYAAWDWRFLALIGFSTLLDYSIGLRLERPGVSRRRWLVLSLVGNLGVLAFFKYFGFFVDSAVAALAALGVQAHRPTFAILLPVGISFYTFQTLSYTIDVYRGELRARRNLLDFALFVAFFPQLVAGPIVRAADFLPQLDEPRRWARVDLRGALVLFWIGFVKKTCISDALAPHVDHYFAAPGDYGALSAWTALLAYAVQVYCDFSGYSDMALACAGLLGYQLPANFARPYLAPNLADFWRRWHVTLTTWLRDYLYLPLGGGRGVRWRITRNLMLTMLLAGLWHGAGWNFVVFGGLHGLALSALASWDTGAGATGGSLRTRLGTAATFTWMCFTLIFFRHPTLSGALVTVRSIALGHSPGTKSLSAGILAALALLATVHVLGATSLRPALVRAWRALPDWAFAGLYGIAVALAVTLVPASPRPFIYFQF